MNKKFSVPKYTYKSPYNSYLPGSIELLLK